MPAPPFKWNDRREERWPSRVLMDAETTERWRRRLDNGDELIFLPNGDMVLRPCSEQRSGNL